MELAVQINKQCWKRNCLVEVDHEFSFEYVEFEVPLSHPRRHSKGTGCGVYSSEKSGLEIKFLTQTCVVITSCDVNNIIHEGSERMTFLLNLELCNLQLAIHEWKTVFT